MARTGRRNSAEKQSQARPESTPQTQDGLVIGKEWNKPIHGGLADDW